MPKKRKSSVPIDKAAEYVDSPLMTQRLRYENKLSARIAGNYGTYRTQVRIGQRESADCSCPSDEWPCKHARALKETWLCNPDSFLDLQELLDQLAGKSKAELLALIGRMALTAPESLSACGIEGFDLGEDEDVWD